MQGMSPDVEFTLWEWEQAGLLSNEELLPTLPPYVQPALIHREGSLKCSNGKEPHDNSVQSYDPSLYRQDLNVTQAAQSPRNTADHTNMLVGEQQPDLVGSYSKEYGRRQASNREHQRRFRVRQKVCLAACSKEELVELLTRHNLHSLASGTNTSCGTAACHNSSRAAGAQGTAASIRAVAGENAEY